MTSETDNRTTELLPCPFCGGDDVNMGVRPHFREGKGSGWTVLCADCGGSIGYIERPDGRFYAEYDTKSEAIAAWNTRAELGSGTCENIAPDYLDFLCNKCGFVHYHSDENDTGDGNDWNYCPNCGKRVSE